jgi:hypothetical protein
MGQPFRYLRPAAARSIFGRAAVLVSIAVLVLAVPDAPAWSRSIGHASGHHAD